MNEIICPLCANQSPEQALYCQHCGQPLRCKDCQSALFPTARFCMQCGKPIAERLSNNQPHQGMGIGTVPPGYNQLKLHETPEARDIDLVVSNEAIQHIGDLFPTLFTPRAKGRYNHQADQPIPQSDVVEITTTAPAAASQPQLPAAVSQPVAATKQFQDGTIWEIFRKQDDLLKLDITHLKASSKKDYTLRVVYLYLYAKMQLGEDTVLRHEVYAFLDQLGLKDNIALYISKAQGIIGEEKTLRLTFEGRKLAEQYIADVFNEDLVDSWPATNDTRSTTTRTKRSNKKSTEQQSNPSTEVAGWISHPLSKELVATIDHGAITELPVLDKILLALYSIYKTGHEQEVALVLIMQYLYAAFAIQVQANTASRTLHKLREGKTAKTAYINFRDGFGYKITPSGSKYIEEALQLKNS